MEPLNFSACIFDFDGVIVDSEPLHAEAKRLTLEHFQIPYPAWLVSEYKGRTDIEFFTLVVAQLAQGRASFEALDEYKRQEYLRQFERVPLMPGIEKFVRAARLKYHRVGLATSATGHDFSLAARKFHLAAWFDVIVTGADTLQHKPHPEPYLKALSGLGIGADQTLVIEDSPNGIRSARAAGCSVAAITTSFGAHELTEAGAGLLAPTFEELGVALALW